MRTWTSRRSGKRTRSATRRIGLELTTWRTRARRTICEGGNRFVAGPITLIERLPSPYRHFQLSPAQTRFIFGRKGWIRVVGFHTRNVAHRVHEHIQLKAPERANADGLYISPVSGPRKTGDFLPWAYSRLPINCFWIFASTPRVRYCLAVLRPIRVTPVRGKPCSPRSAARIWAATIS